MSTSESAGIDDFNTDPPGPPLASLFSDKQPGGGRHAFSALLALVITAGVTALCWAARDSLSPQAVCLIYLGVTVAAGALGSPSLPLPLALTSLLAWNFFFTAPHFTLFIDNPNDRVLFGVFAAVAFTQQRLVARLREREATSRRGEARATLLMNLRVALEHGRMDEALRQLGRTFGATACLVSSGESSAMTDPSGYGLLNLWTKELEVTDNKVTVPLLSATARYGRLALTFPGPVSTGDDAERLLWDVAAILTSRLERDALAASAELARETEISEKLGRTLLDHVTHEMKTPAAIILAALHELRPALRGEGPVSPDTVSALEEAAWRVHLLTDELTARAGISAGLLQPKFELCEAGELVTELLPQLTSESRRDRVHVSDNATGALVSVDPRLTGAILGNLVSNALRHSPPDRPVDIVISRFGTNVAITVRDHGAGIPADHAENCFSRHQSGANPGVLGLGLSIARDFAGMIGGKLTVENRPEGGAAFTLILPEAPAPKLT